MRPPGPLLASGRDADIFEYGQGLVLRRSRRGRSLAAEAEVMELARAGGFPVPAIDELSDDGTELTMERIDGVSMMTVLGQRPWQVRDQARLLAGLHHQLHAIAAPVRLREGPGSTGDRLLHLDLHPMNVIVSSRGPLVIDWANAARGPGATDVAATWVLMACGAIPAGRVKAALMGRFRNVFVRAFVAAFDAEEVRAELGAFVDYKVRDENMSDAECAAMRRLAATEGRPGGTAGR